MKIFTLKCVLNTKENSRREGVISFISVCIFSRPSYQVLVIWAFFLRKNLTFHLVVSIIYNIRHYLFSEKYKQQYENKLKSKVCGEAQGC